MISGAEAVPLVYFDASAFVKLVVEEPGSHLAVALWDGCDAALSSRLSYPEVCSALAAAGRNRDLDEDDLMASQHAWEEYWAAVRPIELTATVERHAGRLAQLHSLRGADAVHVASALAVSDDELILAVWDRRLHTAALATHLQVAPLDLDP